MTSFLDLYLRADTEADLIAALPFARGEGIEGEPIWITQSHAYALDLIGPMVTEPGTYDAEGEQLTPPTIDTRFHANLRLADHALVDEVPTGIIVTPGSPRRVWL